MRSLDLSCCGHKGKVIPGNAAPRSDTCVFPASLHGQELQLFLFSPELCSAALPHPGWEGCCGARLQLLLLPHMSSPTALFCTL